MIRSGEIERVIRVMVENNSYVYCVSYNRPDIDLDTIIGHQNYNITKLVYKELAAYVSKTASTYIDSNYENLQCHENVISKIMKQQDVLPMCFSTICKSEEGVIEMLHSYYDQFIKNIEYITGKNELGIKVFYKLDFEEEDKQDKELLKLPKEYMRVRYERYCNRQKRMDEVLFTIEEYHKKLVDIAVDSCYKKPMRNNLIFNASYLVQADLKDKFDHAVAEMKASNPGYKILYSGPWPAYHFVNIVREGEEIE